jgi:hypothetical protein
MFDQPNSALVDELRYALDVMEEYSHLGLNDEGASKLRQILLPRIAEAEEALARRPAQPVYISAWKSKVSA